MVSTPVISKGSTFVLTTGTEPGTELKSIIIEDPDTVVGEAENIKVTAHDGTNYTTPGETGDNTLSLTLLQTYEEFEDLMTYGYGDPSIDGTKKSWDLSTPSNTSGTITIETPVNGTNQIGWLLKNAKTLSITPALPIGNFASMVINLTGDNWENFLDTGA